jgi:hypothetical protein
MKKIALFTLLTFLALFLSVWAFNHIDAWVGIIGALATIYVVVSELINKINK